ncbi:MAG: hypothetical protein Q8R17_00945 [bacterium]|nr:hypothetical protein [bacterium]
MNNEQSVSPQFLQFTSLVIPNLPRNFRPDRLDYYVGQGKSELKDKLLVAFADDLIQVENDPLKQWETLYREEFGETHDFSGVKIPEKKEGFNRLIIVAKGMTPNRVYDSCEKKFPCWRYTGDLDKGVPTNDRVPNEHYAVLLRDRVEADEELKNLSADDLAEQKVNGVTLLERLLLELKYFRETGKHLDIKNITLCSGSRRAGGSVPYAFWRGGGFRVDWCDRRDQSPRLRSREAVSL